MRSTFNILFFIKKNEVKRNGLCTIMVRITIDGVYLQFSTKTDISRAYWITKQGRAKGCTQYADEINRQLDGIRTGLYMHHSRLRDKYKYITPLMLKKAFLTIEDKTKLGYQFSEQVKFFRSKTGKNIGSNTSFRYGLTWRRIQEFLEKEHNISDIQMERISLGFLEKFYTFMRKDLNYENNTAMKYMQRFSTIMSSLKNWD
ncbi:phage integrase SAM-like domain-containing protein [Dysgonomonas sp. GY617]|uniref:phage integrase SAM-like domain-containing protein n=1 Tax=Dysgonomonas sp. GY617 TaxID=2780420 RepID=UPI0018844277|nr:phage integrase SAM-like domain-containing protein [Dysgonomonas sp. GY617]MBF0578102.1 phage integrase SAM-like domain-containing protein [Dysgonomonas sp. GY617]